MNYGSVCSGIEAASVAWEPLGWRPAWFAEIEAFPSAVLAHHWPDVPNLGDMLTLAARIRAGEVVAPGALVGGTPCQAFSVAGNRDSLGDERGALTLAYVELANAVDERRTGDGQDECIIVWENVPGVLSTKDNAFGCFLAALAGETEPLQPTGKRWSNAGCVYGPQRAIAWRVLDAQYFGVAQRRRRVFLVASARDGFDPAEILFESEGLRRDTAPRREAGQGFAADVAPSLVSSGRGVERIGETRGQDPVVAVPLLEPGARTGKSTTDPRAGIGIGHDGDPMYTLQAGKQHGVATVPAEGYRMVAFGEYADDGSASTMKARDYKDATDLAVCAVTGDIAHTLNSANNGKGCSEDGTGRGVPTIAFSSKDYGGDATYDLSPTLRAGGHSGSHANAGVGPAIAYNVHENQRAECSLNDTSGAVNCSGGKPGQGYPAVLTVALRGREGGGTAELGGDTANALRASTGGGDKPHVLTVHGTQDPILSIDCALPLGRNNGGENAIFGGLAVRRLTPVECERLQGFPDGHTDVPYRSKTASDGPRYKAIGNSKAIPCVAWLGRRIQQYLDVVNFKLDDLLDLDDFDWDALLDEPDLADFNLDL